MCKIIFGAMMRMKTVRIFCMYTQKTQAERRRKRKRWDEKRDRGGTYL